MARRFAGKRVFITGASSGIGAAVAEIFAEEGAKVALTARRVERLEELKRRIEARGGEAIALRCDVCSRASLDEAVAKTAAAFGGIDVVFANAGFGVAGPFVNLETEDWRRQFDTNVFGVVDTLYATLPHLRASGGHIGIVSSVSGRVGTPLSSAYTASKFALCGLAETLYYELADEGITVTLINPGLVASEIRFKNNRGEFKEAAKDPAPRWLVMPTEKAARQIVNAMARRRFETVVTGHGKVLVWLNRHFPRTLRFLLRAASKGKQEQLAKRKRAHPEG